jgi:hypothetical protein
MDFIAASLAEVGVDTAGSIIEDNVNENHYFVYVSVTRDAENKQSPSNRQLRKAQDLIEPQGLTVEFLLSDAASHNIEGGLRATILHAFGGEIRNVFLSVDNRKAFIWLDQKKELDEDILIEVERKIRLYLDALDVEFGALLTTSNGNLPGKLACLNAIRQLAPVSPADLQAELIRRDFKVPSEDWLMRRLDLLRKSRQVIRLSNAKYVLSQVTLANLGTSRSRNSPDVSKMLALARMGG